MAPAVDDRRVLFLLLRVDIHSGVVDDFVV
jgi:hypothetical protein